jgi:hypothetical protein
MRRVVPMNPEVVVMCGGAGVPPMASAAALVWPRAEVSDNNESAVAPINMLTELCVDNQRLTRFLRFVHKLRASHVNGPECEWETLMMVFLIPSLCFANSPTRMETKDRRSHVTSARLLSPLSITNTVAYNGSCMPVEPCLRAE